jgi:hypothetical protein
MVIITTIMGVDPIQQSVSDLATVVGSAMDGESMAVVSATEFLWRLFTITDTVTLLMVAAMATLFQLQSIAQCIQDTAMVTDAAAAVVESSSAGSLTINTSNIATR